MRGVQGQRGISAGYRLYNQAEVDGREYTVRVAALEIPTCHKCGEQVFTVGTDDRIVAALRAQVGLLTPQEMQKRRGQLEMTQQELAEQMGVAKETISRWETAG